MTPFTHLHVHSHFSLLGSPTPIPSLVEQARSDGMTHLALTDRNALYGAVAHAAACLAAGLQPITGMVVTVAGMDGVVDAPGELLLLARDQSGYRSLCRISSAIQGSPQREQIAQTGVAWEVVSANRSGLFCLAGGRDSWLEHAVRADEQRLATLLVSKLAGVFDDACILALEVHSQADLAVAHAVTALSARFGVRTAAVQPVYCLKPSEQPRLRLLAAIAANSLLGEVPATALPGGDDPAVAVHWLHPAEVTARFAAFPAALESVAAIAAECRPALPDGRPIWPVLALPPGESAQSALVQAAQQGMAVKFGADESATRRLQAELAAIGDHGFAPFFLLVADVVRFARAQSIPVSTRGSVANSLVAYCLGITTVDPIANDLLFERFLNPARTSLPDIDLDFCSRRRDEVLAYVRHTYGVDRVALVATVSTFQPRSALRATGKAYGLGEEAIGRLVKLLPDSWHPDPRRRVHAAADEVLQRVSDPTERLAVRDAYALVDQPDHLSIHPGGVVVAPAALTDLAPLQWTPKGFLVTQFAHGDVEAIGLPKIDLLGIRALTVLADATELVRQHFDPHFSLDTIPLDDNATAALLARGETIGVFQCESSGAQRTLRQLKAHTVTDLAVANAFFKPGPATGGMAAAFVRRYRGEERMEFLHPALEPILRKTQGVLLFQEQILRVATEIAGLTWAEAEQLRKGMSKFQPEAMASLSDRFVQGCQRPAPDGPGFTAQQAARLWEQVQAFAGYGFNQGHATAYADVSFRSAYLKTHWPLAFLCARLADWGGFHHPAVYMAEAMRLGIAVRPPHVNGSNAEFTMGTLGDAGKTPAAFDLFMGLGQVRDLRHAAVADIITRRQEGPYTSLADLTRRVALQAKEITHLIQCGALDGLGESRAALLAEAEELHSAHRSQLAFAFAARRVAAETPGQRLAWEEHLLGQPVSVHPVMLVKAPANAVALATVSQSPGRRVTVVAARLPGWTGGKGFFLSDGATFVTAMSAERPRTWQPMVVHGRWMLDNWGGGWLQVESSEPAA